MSSDRRSVLSTFPVLAAALLWTTPSAAQSSASAAEELLAANRRFDEALSRIDVAGILALSLQEPHVIAIHPNAREIARGWDAVRRSWEAVADRFAELSVRLDAPTPVIRDNVGWVAGTEVVTGKRKSGETIAYTALTTNLFEKRGGRWLLSAHLTARVPS